MKPLYANVCRIQRQSTFYGKNNKQSTARNSRKRGNSVGRYHDAKMLHQLIVDWYNTTIININDKYVNETIVSEQYNNDFTLFMKYNS